MKTTGKTMDSAHHVAGDVYGHDHHSHGHDQDHDDHDHHHDHDDHDHDGHDTKLGSANM